MQEDIRGNIQENIMEEFKNILKNPECFDEQELAIYKEFNDIKAYSTYIDKFVEGFILKLKAQQINVEDYLQQIINDKKNTIDGKMKKIEENNIVDLFINSVVRPIEKEDMAAASQLLKNHYEIDDIEIAAGILNNSMIMAEFNHGIFVYDDGEIKGVMIVDTGEIFRTAEIRHFAVKKDENYNKICSEFLKGVVEGIRAEGKYKLYIKVPFENKEDLVFFIKEDFIPETCLWNHLMYKEHAILFSKEIG